MQEEQVKAFKMKEIEKQNLFTQRMMEAKQLRDKQLALQQNKKQIDENTNKQLEDA